MRLRPNVGVRLFEAVRVASRFRRLTLGFVFASICLAGVTFAASDAPPPSALGGSVLVEGAGPVAYISTSLGIEAIDLATGRERWSAAGVARVLAVSGNRLVVHAARPDAILEIRILDATTGSLVRTISLDLPAGVVASVVDTRGLSFRAAARVEGSSAVVTWRFADVRHKTPVADEAREGAYRLDLASGAATKVTAAWDRPLPVIAASLERAVRDGGLPSRPQLSGDTYSLALRAPDGGGERLLLKRWNLSGVALPDIQLHEGSLAVPYVSADGRHVAAGTRNETAEEMIWTVFAADTGARLSEMSSRGAPVPFLVRGQVLVHVAEAFGHRVGTEWVDVPLQLRGLDLGSGTVLWSRALLDLEYRGPGIRDAVQPSGGRLRAVPEEKPEPPRRTTGPKPKVGVGSGPARLRQTDAQRKAAAPQTGRNFVAELRQEVTSISAASSPDSSSVISGVTWTAQGPAPIRPGTGFRDVRVGAIKALAPQPTNADILYVGAVNGGVWKTTNASAANPTWTPLTDSLATSIGALALDPTDGTRNTLVAGVGRFSSYAGYGGPQTGLLRSTDGGANWTSLPSLKNYNVSALAPRGSTIVAVANSGDFKNCADVGVLRSTDTGATFTQVSSGGLRGGYVEDIGSDPSNNAVLYTSSRDGASCGTNNGIYRSVDTGASWVKVSDGTMDALLATAKRVMFAVNPSGHVFVGINGSVLVGLFRSTNRGASWTALDVPDYVDTVNQGDLHMSIAADPVDSNIVYVGGDVPSLRFRIDASKGRGSQVTNLTGDETAGSTNPYSDSRGMAFDAAGNLLTVDDGGVHRRTSPRTSTGDWAPIMGNLQSNECYSVAYDSVAHVLLGGGQDVGDYQQSAAGSSTDWVLLQDGDGGNVAVDSTSTAGQSTRYYSANGLAGFERGVYNAANQLQSKTAPKLTVTSGPAFVALTYSAVVPNAIDAKRLIIAGKEAYYESLDRGDTLTGLSAAAKPDGAKGAVVYGGKLNGSNNADLLYVAGGSGGSHVYFRTTAGAALVETAAKFPGGAIVELVADPSNGATLYALAANKVYVTNNSGGSWREVTGNIATLSTDLYGMTFVPGSPAQLLVSGYGGVFQMDSTAEGAWTTFGTGLPKVIVWALAYDATDRVVVAGTMGRGIWKTAALRPQSAYHPFFAVDTLETPYVGDFNGDRKTDIITFTRQNPVAFGDVYVSLSTGTSFGTNNKWHDFFAINTSEQVLIADYDGDGKDDIGTWLSTTSRQIYVAKSLGNGMGTASVWLDSIGFDSTDVLLAGDANGDGKKDLILFARKQGKVYVAVSDGTKFGTPAVWHNFFAVSTYERPRVADVNGDGKSDIITFATDSPTAFGDVYVATSTGTQFGDKQNSAKWHDFFSIRPTEEIRLGDLNNDGKMDFFTFLPPPFGQLYTTLSEGTGMAAGSVLWRGGTEEKLLFSTSDIPFVGDVNGDGKTDIIIFAQGEGKVYVALAP